MCYSSQEQEVVITLFLLCLMCIAVRDASNLLFFEWGNTNEDEFIDGEERVLDGSDFETPAFYESLSLKG